MAESASQAADATPEPDLTGRRLGDYQLLRRLGRGAMAQVYLAEQSSLRRQVALKVLKTDLAEDPTYVRRFHHEARAAASLVHANIVQIHEVGQVDAIHFIAQEYVQGENLRQLITRSGPLDAPRAVSVMRQVAAALHMAADQGIIHRDIKPDNIMLSARGEVKVADFGLARVTGQGEMHLTQVGITMGTPLYMSPEQAEGRPLDPRSDIYSLGVTCYHMLSGRPPFEGDTPLSLAMQHVRKQPEPLSRQRPDLPAELVRIVHKMLAKDPADRYQQVPELLRDLYSLPAEVTDEAGSTGLAGWSTAERIALGEAGAGSTQRLSALMKTATQQLGRRRRGRWLLAAAVVIAFLLGGTIAWLTHHPPILP